MTSEPRIMTTVPIPNIESKNVVDISGFVPHVYN